MRTKRAFVNLISSMLLQFVTLGVGLVLPRLFITTYGSTINGLSTSIKQFIAYLSLVEAGIAIASTQALYEPLAHKDCFRINGIISATNKFYRQSGWIFTVLIGGLAFLYPMLIGDEVPKDLAVLLVLILGGNGLAEYFLIGKYIVLLTADQKNYIISIVQMLGFVLNCVIAVILMKSGQSIIWVQAVSTSLYTMRVVFFAWYARRKYPYLKFNEPPDMNAISKRWEVLVHQFTGMIVFNSPVVILTIFCGLKDVSVYSIYYMIFSAIGYLLSAFSNGLTAAFGEVLAKDEQKALTNAFGTFEYLYISVIAWIYTVTTLLCIPFVKLYTAGIKDANYIDPVMVVLFACIGVANNLRVPQGVVIGAAGHFKETRNHALIEAGINLLGSLVFVRIVGVYGVLLGSMCSYAYRTGIIIHYGNQRILQQDSWVTVIRIFRNMNLSAMVFILFGWVFPVSVQTWLQWIQWICIVCSTSLLIIIGGNALFERSRIKDIFYRLSQLLGKNSIGN